MAQNNDYVPGDLEKAFITALHTACVANHISLAGEAGLYGNAYVECGAIVKGDSCFNPEQEQFDYHEGVPDHGGKGPFQLDNDKKCAFLTYKALSGAEFKGNWTSGGDWSLENQFKFVFDRNNTMGEGNYATMLAGLQSAATSAEGAATAAELFERMFEVPAAGNPQLNEREAAARRYFAANGYPLIRQS